MFPIKNFIKNKNRGATLILFVFILSLTVTGILIKSINNLALTKLSQQDEMSRAKQALIAWAVTNSDNIGQLPYPDRYNGGGYDGFSDCPPSKTPFNPPASYALLIGKLPVYGQTTPCVGNLTGLGLGAYEYTEKRLWYAVSRNVVHHYEFAAGAEDSNPIINPSIINSPPYPWLKVLDKNGNLISDRVAAVIIAPGDALANQSRSITASIGNFLDGFKKNGKSYSNADYDTADEDFVLGDAPNSISYDDTSFSRPYFFNDQLVFITIDELIAALNKRVLAEGKWLLNAYNSKKGEYPNAAHFAKDTFDSDLYNATSGESSGLLPLDVTDYCQCVNDQSCTCHFGAIESVTMYRANGTWNISEDSGACKSTLKSSRKECTCTGAGSCSRSFSETSTRFTCLANGECTHTLENNPENKFIYALPSHLESNNTETNCLIRDIYIDCNGSGSFSIGLNEPAWFKKNRWQQFVYYTFSPTSSLQAGETKNISALLIAMGQTTTTALGVNQNRPSSLIQDYLDSLENTNGDNIFESVLKKTNSQYNDEILIVAQ